MSKRTTTRVTYEFTREYENIYRAAPDANTLQRWIFDKWVRDVYVTEISRETVKGPKTDRQETFEEIRRRFLEWSGRMYEDGGQGERDALGLVDDALQAEIEKMEEER